MDPNVRRKRLPAAGVRTASGTNFRAYHLSWDIHLVMVWYIDEEREKKNLYIMKGYVVKTRWLSRICGYSK